MLRGADVGFCGIIWFNQKLCVFTRPLKAGAKAQELLAGTAEKLAAFADEFFRQELSKRMDEGAK